MELSNVLFRRFESLKDKIRQLEPEFILPCMTHKEIKKFETQFEIELPVEYKIYLTQIGNGSLGLCPLQRHPLKDISLYNAFENLKIPFPYKTAWNIEDFKDFV